MAANFFRIAGQAIDKGLSVGTPITSLSSRANSWSLFDIDETMTLYRPKKAKYLEDIPTPYPEDQIDATVAWRPWIRSLTYDIPDEEMAGIFRAAREQEHVGIITARSMRGQSRTEKWLERHDLVPDKLIMRPQTKGWENMPTAEYKLRMLDENFSGAKISHMYDDHPGVIAAFQERGIPATLWTPKQQMPDSRRHSTARMGIPSRSRATPKRYSQGNMRYEQG